MFFSLVLVRYAQATDKSPAKVDIRAEIEHQAVRLSEQLFTTYRNYSHNAFFDLISDDFLPSKLEFINSLEADLAEIDVADVTITSLFVLPSTTKLAVRVKWEKKILSKDKNTLQLISGNALLVFKQDNHTWKLFRIKGDNPF